MLKFALSAAALCLLTTASVAQSQPAQPGPQNQAVKGVHENNSSEPVKGANSFTMAEAKSQIEAKGYSRVAGLVKDKDGIWRGTAVKGGKKGPVTVDYQGNVN